MSATLESVNELERNLGVSLGFSENLLKEDDWSFLIKLHALVEAAITHLLTETLTISMGEFSADNFRKSSLSKLFAWDELSNRRTGKATLAHSLGLIFDFELQFIYQLSELRNSIVHNVRNTSFSLDNYIVALDKNQRENFIAAFGYSIKSDEKLSEAFSKKVTRNEFILDNPKISIWLSGLACLEDIQVCIESFTLRENVRHLENEKLHLLDSFIPIVQAASKLVESKNTS